MRQLMLMMSMIALTSCGPKIANHDLIFLGDANTFAQSEKKAFGGASIIENSMVWFGGEVVYFYDPNADSSMVRHDSRGRETVLATDARFSYVIERQGALVAFVTRFGDVYRLDSTDGRTWTESGLVIAHDQDPTSPLHQLWNVGVDVDDQGVWHLLVESSDASPGQDNVGLVYLTSTDGFNFTSHGEVIPHGGNPYVKFIAGQGLLVIHGQSGDPRQGFGAEWYVTASTFDGTTWATHQDRFIVGTRGVHVCDPHVIAVGDRLMMTVSVDQNTIYKAEATDTFEALFARLTQ